MILDIVLTLLIFLLSIFLSFKFTKYWISVAKKNNLLGKDMNKFSKPEVAEAGGIAVIAAILISTLGYVFVKTFILSSENNIIKISTLIITILMACFIGFIDDILGWKKGLKQWHKLLLTLPIAIPLVVINAGTHLMLIPFIGPVNFGWIYPIILIPLAIMGTTNGYNILAGYNGLEASLGILIFSSLGVVSVIVGELWLAIIALIVVGALFGFLAFNKYPSKVFPGDSLTYTLGALVGCFAILGNMERITLIIFIPFIIEGFLKLRMRLKAENFGRPNKDNSLEPPYKENHSLTHVALRIVKFLRHSNKAYERDVVYLLLLFELLMIILAFLTI